MNSLTHSEQSIASMHAIKIAANAERIGRPISIAEARREAEWRIAFQKRIGVKHGEGEGKPVTMLPVKVHVARRKPLSDFVVAIIFAVLLCVVVWIVNVATK